MLHIMQARFCGMHLFIYITLKSFDRGFYACDRATASPTASHSSMYLRHIAGQPRCHAACGRLKHKYSDLQTAHIELRTLGSAGRVTLFTALVITGRSDEFGLESVLWRTDQNGPDA